MDPAGELVRLASDVSETFGLYPEHMDRLVLIGHDINRIYRPTLDFMIALREFEDYFERWGVCSDVFWSFHAKCPIRKPPATLVGFWIASRLPTPRS